MLVLKLYFLSVRPFWFFLSNWADHKAPCWLQSQGRDMLLHNQQYPITSHCNRHVLLHVPDVKTSPRSISGHFAIFSLQGKSHSAVSATSFSHPQVRVMLPSEVFTIYLICGPRSMACISVTGFAPLFFILLSRSLTSFNLIEL